MERPKRVTAEELWSIPDNGSRLELVRGEVCEMAPAGGEHGEVGMNLTVSLGHFVKSHKLGRMVMAETGFLIARDPDTVRAPDCAFLSRERAPARLGRKYVEVIPDLVVEVVSPDDRAEEVSDKVGQWLAAGVRLVWVVYPKSRTVAAHQSPSEARTFHEDEVLTGDDVVPGFELPISEIFE